WAENTANFPDGVVLPLSEWQGVPEFLRAVTWLALPRWAAANDAERIAAAEVKRSAAQGFAGFFVQNLAHIRICHGLPMFGGFGLNVTNALAARAYAQLGLGAMTLSVEMTVDDMAAVAPNGAKNAALIYGHVPLLLTRACPLQNVRTCKNCTRQGELLDRKGKYFPVSCSAPAAAGVRTVYNPIPIYMGDKLRTMPVEIAFMQFTAETPEQVFAVLRCVRAQQPFEGEFTRGLYFKGTQ
ncbi:MAG: U32 family peptidase, partial [Ruthenibacterium sp.]